MHFEPARDVWVLGASLGGPEAVAEFLEALPPGLPICLVYAQHIDANFTVLLSEVVARQTDFDVVVLEGDMQLRHGQMAVVPVDTTLRIRSGGRVEACTEAWPGPFSPCIGQVIEDVALAFSENAGAIIFSGMAEDGAAACGQIRSRGGSVWAQSAETCICSSMPDAATATGMVEYEAAPAELAAALAQRYTSYSLQREGT